MEKISYALGVSLGNNLKNSGFSQIDTQRLTDGIRHAIKGEPLDMSLNEAQKIVNEYLQQLQKQTFENNIREGKEFLTNNAKRPGVKTKQLPVCNMKSSPEVKGLYPKQATP